MSNPLNVLHINDAVGKKNKFDRSRIHLTTMEIGECPIPVFHEDCIIGDTYHYRENYFARLAPLAVPTFGTFLHKTATFFVPYYQVFEGAEAFFGGKSISRGKNVHLPFMFKWELVQMFLVDKYSTASTSSAADFSYTILANSVSFRKFTPRGKRLYKVLRSLGYQLPSLVSSTSSLDGAPNGLDKLNMLPFLCYVKAWNDFLSQSQRFDVSEITSLLESIRLDQTVSGKYNASDGHVSRDGVLTLYDGMFLQYESDYFTSCWARPSNPLSTIPAGSTNLMYTVEGSTGLQNTVHAVEGGTYFNPNPDSIYQRTLDTLKAFDNWIRRNNYAGSKDVDKIYARFGVKPEDFKASYAHLISTSVSPVQVGDVTSLTDSKTSDGGVVLGDYAGKGIVNHDHVLEYTAQDYGMLLTLSWITIKPVYSNGFDRTVLKTSPLDFYNPEFDGLSGNPVSQQEIYTARLNPNSLINRENQIFGFNERYSEYKTGNLDQITGDFCIFKDMEAWHFDRTDLNKLQAEDSLNAQSAAFNSVIGYDIYQSGGNIPNIYNRIFNSEADLNSSADHFYVTAQFDVTAYRPMKSLNEVPDLGQGDVTISRNGTTIS